jgi:short-subunit dehydrogenase
MANILIIGASSAIAEAVARKHAQRNDSLFLVARSSDRLDLMSADLKVRGASQVETACLDVNDITAHEAVIDRAFELTGRVDVVLIAHGTLPEQEQCEASVERTLQEINTNAFSTVALLTDIANRMAGQGIGTIAVITSVAGDRGRQSNYVYGAAKGMVSVFLQGLRNRLSGQGVNVLDIKPGFVDTPMTAAFDKGPLWATPEQVASGIVSAVDKRKAVVYLPWFWFFIMQAIKSIPEFIFKKLSL